LLTSLAIYFMRLGTALAALWLSGGVLTLFGLTLNFSSATFFILALGIVLVSRLLGAALLVLAGSISAASAAPADQRSGVGALYGRHPATGNPRRGKPDGAVGLNEPELRPSVPWSGEAAG
jgi:hypothetical protein